MWSSNRIQFFPACVSLGSDLDAYTYLAIYSSLANLVISMGLEQLACHTQDGIRQNLHIFPLIT